VHGIAGGTVLGNGRVVLVLELSELLSPRLSVTTGTPGVTGTPARRESSNAMSIQQPTPAAPVSPPVSPERQVVPGSTRPLSRQTATRPHGKHILVVDDSPSVRRVVGNMLKQHGWEVQLARDGVEALEMITQETPAAVLLDIEMPRMDGYELMATVRAQEQYRTLPIVILTSRAATKHQQRAMQLGANGYLVKPYQDEEMLNLLNALVYGATVQ
jgi:CheY-like chemotaxis protein